MNYNGMLGTNPDQTISHVKPVCRAAQHVFTIFDGNMERRADYPATTNVAAPRKLALTGYTQRGSNRQIVALWFNDAAPLEDNAVTSIDVTLTNGSLKQPVLVDVRTGLVYKVSADQWKQSADGTEFRGIPVYDSPVLIAEGPWQPSRDGLSLLESLAPSETPAQPTSGPSTQT